MNEKCPFCNPDKKLIVAENAYNLVLANPSQVEKLPFGIMIIPKKHLIRIDELGGKYASFFELLQQAKTVLSNRLKNSTTGFNILINEGIYAGQNIEHLHAHIFPRIEGDSIVNMARPTRRNITDEELRVIHALFGK